MAEKLRRNKGMDEMFCPSCGEIIKREAVICVHCGVAVSDMIYSKKSKAFQKQIEQKPKRKSVALTLSLTLGYFSWFYTIKIDWWKFLICFFLLQGLAILILVDREISAPSSRPAQTILAIFLFAIAWFWPSIQNGLRSQNFFDNL